MEQEPPIFPSWQEKVSRTSLALAVTFAFSLPQRNPEIVCETAISQSSIEREEAPLLGFTFNPNEARYVGLEPKFAMEELLKMGFDQVRIAMYANQPTNQMVEEIKWQTELAKQYDTEIVLVLGRKSPGWPEEYLPRYAYSETLQKTLAVLEAVAATEQVKLIQVSNEPLYADQALSREDPELLAAMLDLILPYGKPTLITSFADPVAVRMETFQAVLSLGDIGGIDVYIETGAGRGSCVAYSEQLQHYNQLAKNAGKPLLITELQTLPWPDQIRIPIPGRAALYLPLPFQQNLQPAEIRKLYKMVLINTDPESIFFWEMGKLLALEQQGNPTRMNEIRRIIEQNHSTRQQLLYRREQAGNGIISFSYDHSRFLGADTSE